MLPPRESIRFDMSLLDVLVLMSEGNPGAITVLNKVLEAQPEMGFLTLLSIDDMNLRGSQIWVAYKDHCKEDILLFLELIRERDQAMVDAINASQGLPEGTPPAVTHGASWNNA